MKFLEAITHRLVGRRVDPMPPLTFYTDQVGPAHPGGVTFRFEATLRGDLTGPAQAMPELRQRAARMFAHELYSDVLHELRELRRELYTEPVYRDANDPVLRRLYALESKLKGEM